MKNTPTESELKTGVTYTVYLGGDKTSSPVKSTILVKTKEGSDTPVETVTYKIGDFDKDGDVDATDLTAIRAYLKLLKNSNSKYHVNEDLTNTTENTTYKIGDLDRDGDVDATDLTAIRAYLKLLKNSNTKYHVNEDVLVDKQ